ncbi:RmlC-like cupin [Lentithecium fluviatile CBS 122367]|uniref:RmlC-like cupin n=1 Tax=Lentithecium fluviatile CBS 122367 TaxID=1168545 RepID=A0A6G1JCU6_9PLEO|nr:RmlC-like cupin [Lentithecium fluviatile CBS 122367]
MVTITKTLIAGLAFGAVNAYPQAASPSTAVAYTTTPASTPTATPPAPADDAEKKAALFRDLFTAPTAIKRFQRLLTAKGESLLSGETLRSLTVFNFNGAKPAEGAEGGATKAANIESFPILTGLGISTTLGFLDACGINTPHVHPRATEFLTVVEGTVDFGYILENGLVAKGNPEIAGTLGKFEGTVFPMGSIHYQFNPKCEPATFVAALNSEDPGTSQVAQNFFNLNAGVINATLGFPKTIDGKNIEEFRKAIPVNIAQDIDNCLAKCKKSGGY